MEHYAVFRVSFLIFARNGMGLDLLEEARERRALARRTRRMGEGLSEAAARARVNRYADVLEKRAAEREARAVQGRAWGPRLSPLSPTSPIRSIVRRSRCNHFCPLAFSAGCFGADCRPAVRRQCDQSVGPHKVLVMEGAALP